MASGVLAPQSIFAGQFRVRDVLGESETSVVYGAEQLGTGEGRALKVFLPVAAADPRFRAAFFDAAQVGARVTSPHVAHVLAAGIDERSGAPWLASELLDGYDVAARVARRGPVAYDKTRGVLGQIAQALAAAERAGVAHGDLVPDNVFLARSGQQDGTSVVKVLNFGVGRLAHALRSPALASRATARAAWLAPEQRDRPDAPATAAGDVYSLGLLAFYLLAGRAYWHAAGPVASPPEALLREVARGAVASPSRRVIELALGAQLPPGFDAWFARCTASDPSQRFAHATAAHAALLALPTTGSSPGAGAAAAFGVAPMPSHAGFTPPPAAGPFGPPRAGPFAPPVAGPFGPQSSHGTAEGSGAQGARARGGAGKWFLALGLLALVGGGGAYAWYVLEDGEDEPEPEHTSQCASGLHPSRGHCCPAGFEWSGARAMCEVASAPGAAAQPAAPSSETAPPAPAPAPESAPAPLPAPAAVPTSAPAESGAGGAAAPSEPEASARTAPPANAPPQQHPCVGRWQGEIVSARSNVAGVTLQVTGAQGSCGRWREHWGYRGVACEYRVDACRARGGRIEGTGRLVSGSCGSTVGVSMTCGASSLRFREVGEGDVDQGVLRRR